MPNGRKIYWSAGHHHLTNKALSPIGANVVTHCIVGFNWSRLPKNSEILEPLSQASEDPRVASTPLQYLLLRKRFPMVYRSLKMDFQSKI